MRGVGGSAESPDGTRRHLRRYLSTWVDWKSSNCGEPLRNFVNGHPRQEHWHLHSTLASLKSSVARMLSNQSTLLEGKK